MAENETLGFTSRLNTRWVFVRNNIHSGASGKRVLEVALKYYRQTLVSVWNLWNERGIRPEDFFKRAACEPDQLEDVLKLARWDEYARLLKDVAKYRHGSDLKHLVHGFLIGVWEMMSDKTDVDVLSDDQSRIVHSGMDNFLTYLAERMAADPSRIPRLPPGISRKPDIDDLLDEQLPLA